MECGKKKFKSEKGAIKFGRGKRLSRISGNVRAYYCKDCRHFHLTTSGYGKKR